MPGHAVALAVAVQRVFRSARRGVIFLSMSLLPFHRVLIASAIIFCAGFSALELFTYARHGRLLDLLLGLGFAVAAGALIVYLWHLRRILRLPKQRRQEWREER